MTKHLDDDDDDDDDATQRHCAAANDVRHGDHTIRDDTGLFW